MTLSTRLPALSIALRTLSQLVLVAEFAVRCLEENPKFPEGGTLEGNPLLFGFNFGYRF